MAYYRTADATVAAHKAVAVVPSDVTVLNVTRGLYVGVAGNVAVVMADDAVAGTVSTFVGVPAGTILPVQVVKVMVATTATSMLALY